MNIRATMQHPDGGVVVNWYCGAYAGNVAGQYLAEHLADAGWCKLKGSTEFTLR